MDRFSWSDGILRDDEQLVCQQSGVRLYDGNDKAKSFIQQLLVLLKRFIKERPS